MNDFTQSIVAALTLIGRLDSELIAIVGLSLRVSLSASLIALLIGAPLGVWLATRGMSVPSDTLSRTANQ